MKKPQPPKEIAVIEGVTWTLEPDRGRITGVMKGIEVHEFWTGNPPTLDRDIFVAICELAVARGLLRRIHTYAVVSHGGVNH